MHRRLHDRRSDVTLQVPRQCQLPTLLRTQACVARPAKDGLRLGNDGRLIAVDVDGRLSRKLVAIKIIIVAVAVVAVFVNVGSSGAIAAAIAIRLQPMPWPFSSRWYGCVVRA